MTNFRRFLLTIIVIITFCIITLGILLSIHTNTEVSGEWKELLLLLLGAFIGHTVKSLIIGLRQPKKMVKIN